MDLSNIFEEDYGYMFGTMKRFRKERFAQKVGEYALILCASITLSIGFLSIVKYLVLYTNLFH